MSLHETIKDLNKVSDVLRKHEQRGFFPHLTITHVFDEKVGVLVESIIAMFDDTELDNDEMSIVQFSSIIAFMSTPLKMKDKVVLLDFILRWATVTDIDKSALAIVVQSLRVSDISYNDVYAIRAAVFNYLTKPEIHRETTIKFLSNGKLEIHPRNFIQFEGDTLKQHIFTLLKLQKLVYLNQITTLVALAQYDFGVSDLTLPRSHQIRKRLSTYKVSGYKAKDGQNWFAKEFGKSITAHTNATTDLETSNHYSALKMYRNCMEWASKVKNKSSEKSSESEREDEEELNDSWNSSSSDETSEHDSGIHSSSDYFSFSPTAPSIFFVEPEPTVIPSQEEPKFADFFYYYNKVKPVVCLFSQFFQYILLVLTVKF